MPEEAWENARDDLLIAFGSLVIWATRSGYEVALSLLVPTKNPHDYIWFR